MTTLFRTVVPVRRSPALITHKSTILCVGSCFAETIGTRLTDYRFDCVVNPSGILFNPASMAGLLERLMQKKPFVSSDLFLHQGLWSSFNHHSRFSGPDPAKTLGMMNDRFSAAAVHLDRATVLMLTFGTAAVYCHKDSGAVVANCHRLPHEIFERRLLSIDEIVYSYDKLLSALIAKNSALTCILTVSPVRHLRDDPHENSISKARLIAAVDELERRFMENVYYFPAYEIMMDELRDYRFYATDMAHPSDTAVAYIRDRFYEACVGERERSFIREYEPIMKSREHRIHNEETTAAVKFQQDLATKIGELKNRYPEVNLDDA